MAKAPKKASSTPASKPVAVDATKTQTPSEAYKKAPSRRGRFEYFEETAEEIFELMVNGHDLVSACHILDIPRSTVYRWMDEVPSFKTRCARAREALADYDAYRIAEIAQKTTNETCQADRVKLAALQWLASKRAPKVYGDKIEIDASVEVNRGPSEQLLTFLSMAERMSRPSSSG